MATGTNTRMSDEELLRLPPQELVRKLRRAEAENMKLMMSHGALVKDINQRMQAHLQEIRNLNEMNQRFRDDNQELRDLCCFLDDDRQKGRKLAREWQRFGRYTASVMRQEVASYQSKLQELENKQQELIRDNLELKKLCLCLDEERSRSTCSQCGEPLNCRRDDGDGSSSSTNNEELGLLSPIHSSFSSYRMGQNMDDSGQRHRSVINAQVLQYIKSLERKIQELEEEKFRDMKNKMNHGFYGKNSWTDANSRDPLKLNDNMSISKPEAVVHAMKVLEVHEQMEKSLESDLESEELAEGERALVREMCNVAWRKLEDGPS
ncbi:coiled-coil domain-containing protein 85C-A-like [Argiope bruennichi]|uniref:coiled-coil domain-containing protein 85C-A-like n=1 Tax=Argiope bruennichi TaxID=94029 RepID=UPI00249463D5|nr:coiled-coil domain-containing protein 85C-A-like [Argiope bruennichi]XP_055937884.1 coiled-coil domain-containing protein 85C-A-like [Argiope bruennichi]XP_055937885.1 coiled-coil domain-containing protein 85C-A-like [Argiope bruennichi]